MDGLAQIFSDTSYTSLRYDDGLTLSWHMGGSVPNTVYTLADVFVEWFLFDSGEQKTLDDFLVAESMQNIFTSQQFMYVMSGAVHIDDRLCRVLPEILPFKITSHRLLAMNNLIKSTTPCMPYNIDAMHTKLQARLLQNVSKWIPFWNNLTYKSIKKFVICLTMTFTMQ